MWKIQLRISESMRIDLEEYILLNNLHMKGVKLSTLVANITKEFIKGPIIDKSRLVYWYRDEEEWDERKVKRINVYLSDNEYDRLYKLFVKEYNKNCKTQNVLVYNFIKQFIENNRIK